MRKCVTVVFEVKDQDIFHAEMFIKLKEKMLCEGDEPWKVSAISFDDEITRLDILEDASSLDDGQLVMADIFSSSDIANKTLADFIGS